MSPLSACDSLVWKDSEDDLMRQPDRLATRGSDSTLLPKHKTAGTRLCLPERW